jgi:hypothetical protein
MSLWSHLTKALEVMCDGPQRSMGTAPAVARPRRTVSARNSVSLKVWLTKLWGKLEAARLTIPWRQRKKGKCWLEADAGGFQVRNEAEESQKHEPVEPPEESSGGHV